MKYFYTVLILLFCSSGILIHAQGVPAWVNTTGSTGDDIGKSVAVDSVGNVYMAGTFSGSIKFGITEITSKGGKDFVVACYKSDGTVVWAKNFGGLGEEIASSITCDATGNLTIVGSIAGNVDFGDGLVKPVGAVDGVVFRLTSLGEFVWATRIGGASDDNAKAVVLDGLGNSYITGSFSDTLAFKGGTIPTLRSPGGTDAFLMKVNKNGDVVWAKRAGGISYEEGLCLGYDKQGLVTMSGTFFGAVTFPGGGAKDLTSVGNYDIFIAQYTKDGVPVWSQQIGGGNEDSPRGMAVSDSGIIYLTGSYSGQAIFNGSSYILRNGGMFLARYSTDGYPDWATRVGNNQSDIGNSIALDKNENVFVTGDFYGTTDFKVSNIPDLTSKGNSDAIIACYSTVGLLQWAMRIGGDKYDNGNSISANDHGDLFVTGTFQSTAEFPGGEINNILSKGAGDIYIARYNIPKFSIVGYITFEGNPFDSVIVSDGNHSTMTGNDGLYEFKEVPNGTYTIVPSKKGYEFVPPSQQVTVKNITPNGVNFIAQFVLIPPVLVYPEDLATKVATSTALTWEATVGAKQYHVQVSRLPLFPDFILNDSTISGLSVSVPNLAVATEYYWRVRAADASHWSDWTVTRRFVTADSLPGQVILSTPQNQSSEQPIDQLFSWKILSGAGMYHLQVATNADFSTIVVEDSTTTATAKPVKNLQYATRYYWRVRGFVNGLWGTWSDIWNFRTSISNGVNDPADQQNSISLETIPSPVIGGTSLGISYSSVTPGNLSITSLLGETMFESSTNPISGFQTIDVSNWASGMYVVRLRIGTHSISKMCTIVK